MNQISSISLKGCIKYFTWPSFLLSSSMTLLQLKPWSDHSCQSDLSLFIVTTQPENFGSYSFWSTSTWFWNWRRWPFAHIWPSLYWQSTSQQLVLNRISRIHSIEVKTKEVNFQMVVFFFFGQVFPSVFCKRQKAFDLFLRKLNV